MVHKSCNIAAVVLGGMAVLAMPCQLGAQDKEKLGAAGALEQAADGARLDSPFAKLLRSRHRIEKGLLVRACQLSEEQRREVDKLDDSWKEVVPKLSNAAAQRQLAGGALIQPERAQVILQQRGINFPRQNGNNFAEVLQKYCDSLHEQFGKILTPEQREVYEAERKARDEFAQQAGVEALIAILDKALNLQPKQRAALTKALADHPGYDQFHAAYYLQNEGALPQVPEAVLAKHLTEEQLSVYRQARKVDARISRNAISSNETLFGE